MTSVPARLPRRIAAALLSLTFIVALGACGPTGGSKDQAPISPHGSARASQPADDADLAKPVGPAKGFGSYYKQKLTWQSCDMQFQCATIEVPMDWSDAKSVSIKLALERRVATGERRGSLVINPGGPGARGTEFVTYTPYIFGKTVLAAYDVVGFDPRGVGKSAAVQCYDDAQWDVFNAESFPTNTPEGLTRIEATNAALGVACAANTGELIRHVDTISSARDMDVIRTVLGDDRLNYLGFSYGTQLGSTYAALFPGNVGRMVLDGAIDPTLTPDELVEGQAAGFEQAVHAYVADCQSGASCPLGGTVEDGMATIAQLLDGLLARPMPTNDPARPLTQSLGMYGLIYPLYAQSLWPTLTDALTSAINDNDGSGLLDNADSYNSRKSSGTYADNSGQAFLAISCLDPRQSSDPAAMAAEAAQLDVVAPTVGKFMAYGGLMCKHWPADVVELDADLSAPGTPPIVVVGTTGDPATPYAWAQGLASTLSSGVLVTYDGEGHTAYGSSNECVLNAVDDYLVQGVTPQDGTRC